MTFSLFAEICVCVLAVWGVYSIFRSFVAWCMPRRNISLGVHTTPDKSEYELYCELREAALISEASGESFCAPVVLVDGYLSVDEIEKIENMGVSVYYKRGKSERN